VNVSLDISAVTVTTYFNLANHWSA